jgi:hypothetical protein
MSSVPTSMTPSAPICFLSKARLHCSTWAIGSQATARQTVRGGTTALVARRLAAERAVSRGGCLSAQSSSAGYNPAPAGGPSQICCTGRADHAHASRQYETIRMSHTLVRGRHQQTACPTDAKWSACRRELADSHQHLRAYRALSDWNKPLCHATSSGAFGEARKDSA